MQYISKDAPKQKPAKNTVGGLKLQMDKQGRAHLEKS